MRRLIGARDGEHGVVRACRPTEQLTDGERDRDEQAVQDTESDHGGGG
ncbi:MAG: hypothetical protein JWP68_1890, partial [Modestobacter sp.]|nr:hypothetical protein [Modestobacter sp.]